MSGVPTNSESKNQTPATAPGISTSEPRGIFEVKEKVPYESLKRSYSSTLSGRVLLGLLDYCRANKVSPGKAIVDLVEFRLVQLGHLPEWWYERKR